MQDGKRWIYYKGRRILVNDNGNILKNGVSLQRPQNKDIFESKNAFKDYVKEQFKEFEKHIDKIYLSKENKAGQWGVYIKGKETLSPTTRRFYNYETYIPFENIYKQDKSILQFTIDNTKAEMESFYKR